jgi:hypothetical protein
VRIRLTSDGLEVRSESTIGAPRACYAATLSLARVRPDGTFTSGYDMGNLGTYPLRGRVARDGRTVRGRGRALCSPGGDGREVRVTFRARRTARAPAPSPTAVVGCERLTRGSTAVVLPAARGVGCGLAHDAARAILRRAACADGACTVSGLACAPAPGELDPAATIRCASAAGTVELTHFAGCGTDANDRLAIAAPAVPCAEARALAQARFTETPTPFACAALDDVRWSPTGGLLPRYERCADPADPRRAVEIADVSPDVV